MAENMAWTTSGDAVLPMKSVADSKVGCRCPGVDDRVVQEPALAEGRLGRLSRRESEYLSHVSDSDWQG